MKEILIGTTNPSKVNRFQELLRGQNIKFYTLTDLNINNEPDESGSTPEENAVVKARFYGKYFDSVICNDSGLYFDGLPLDDARQPGLNVRTPNNGKRLDDEEMIAYYSRLIHSLGGRVKAYYLDGIAVYSRGKIYSFMDENAAKTDYFYMVDKPSAKRQIGWPLDSISLNKDTLAYFVDDCTADAIIVDDYKEQIQRFLHTSLGL